MASTKKPQLTTQGGRNIIFVNGGKADSLRKFLVAKGVRSGPPEVVTAETSSLEIGRRDDLIRVQALLKTWGEQVAVARA